MFQYDLTALYATEENNSETKTSDSQAVGTPMDSETRTRGLVRMNSMGEVAVRCVILVATDGLYDMMSNDDAVVIAFKHWGDPAAAAEEMIVETGQSKYITMHLVPQDALYWRFACVLTNRITMSSFFGMPQSHLRPPSPLFLIFETSIHASYRYFLYYHHTTSYITPHSSLTLCLTFPLLFI